MKYWISGVQKTLKTLQAKENEIDGTRMSMRLTTASNQVSGSFCRVGIYYHILGSRFKRSNRYVKEST